MDRTTKLKSADLFRFMGFLLLAISSSVSLLPALLRFRFDRDRAAWQTVLGAELARYCERCGPAAIKVAQLASSREDLLPKALSGQLSRVQDKARPPTRRSISRALSRAYGSLESVPFTMTSWVPVAAGSIAVVLEARLPSGEPIAVKLVRHGVRQKVASDLRIIYVMMRLVEQLPRFRPFPLSEIVTDLSRLIHGQCDMCTEASIARRFAAMAGDDVHIPSPLIEFTRVDVLPMLYLRGTPWSAEEAAGEIYKNACRRLLLLVYRMIFVHGLVHCDLHPGNLQIGTDGVPILYDYGLVAELDRRNRQIFLGLFVAIATRNAARAAFEVLRSASKLPENLDRAAFEAEMALIVERWGGRPAGEFLVAALVRDLFALQHRHQIHSAPGFISAVWSLATFEGLVRHHYPELDFQGEALNYILSAQCHGRVQTVDTPICNVGEARP
ncbi:ABC1 kinase family protein [Mesorhizobium sp. ES1-6]|uniref:ABC1 kinase family protein n=1 Tax=Mesorhizobium sp. ES1-6 TaxID=2876626 RepID=UPI001CCDA724|nr:AarF/UbiB family protein [Mesorhizobium sp. ES1-6]MBZ9803455.1 hypothetical protein [Mesorhizobium sp. ES1-6]